MIEGVIKWREVLVEGGVIFMGVMEVRNGMIRTFYRRQDLIGIKRLMLLRMFM